MSPYPDKRRTADLPKRVLFLNDVCFQYGAGVAQARQVEAFLALGIEVGVLAWSPGDISLENVATRAIDYTLWRGIRQVNHLEGGKMSDDAVVAGLLMEVARFNPTIVLVGNLHAARWPFRSCRHSPPWVAACLHLCTTPTFSPDAAPTRALASST